MGIEVTWYGHASFRLACPQNVVYIDPWKLTIEPHDADVVFVSHSHYDHCSPPDIAKVSTDETIVVAPAETLAQLHLANAITPDERIYIKGVQVETVAAYNIGKAFHPRGNNWFGAVFTLGGQRVYYAGDTDLIPEMNDLKDVDLALLPVGGTYTLSAQEAAQACKAIAPRIAIPYHWGDVVGSAQDARAFAAAACCAVRILDKGQAYRIDD